MTESTTPVIESNNDALPKPQPPKMPVAEMEPPEVCERCGGMGVYGYDVPCDHPLYTARINCECEAGQRRLREIAAARLRATRLPIDLAPLTFESLTALEGQDNHAGARIAFSESQREAISMGLEFVQFGHVMVRDLPRPGLFLFGDRGRGKSGIAASIVNARVQTMGEAALYITVPDLLDHLRATFDPQSEIAYDDLFEQVKSVPLLVLDDLGTENPTAWVVEKLYQIVDFRYRNRLSILVTSNLSPGELGSHYESTNDYMGGRILDRLVTMCAVVEITGPNLRR